MKIKKLLPVLLVLAAKFPACASDYFYGDSGGSIWINGTGLAYAQERARVAALGVVQANVLLGNTYDPHIADGEFILPITNNPAFPQNGDSVVSPAGAVSPTTPPGGTVSSSNYSKYSRVAYHGNENSCTSAVSVSASGTCTGTVVGFTHIIEPLGSSVGPWYHPKCSCDGACALNSPGCPYVTGSPCVPFGDGIDRFAEGDYTLCTNSGVTGTGSAFPNAAPPQAPSGDYQPTTYPSAAVSHTAAMIALIDAAMAYIAGHPLVPDDSSNPMKQAYGFVSDGSIALHTPLILPPGSYTYPPGSPAATNSTCSTCAAISPSSSALSNVWVTNGQLHVYVDNQVQGSSSTIIFPSTFTLADADVLEVSTVSVYTSTHTLAGAYAEFVAAHSTRPAVFQLADKFHLPTLTPDESWRPEWCFDNSIVGHKCIDLEPWGFWTIIGFLRFFVIAGAFVAAYYIVAS